MVRHSLTTILLCAALILLFVYSLYFAFGRSTTDKSVSSSTIDKLASSSNSVIDNINDTTESNASNSINDNKNTVKLLNILNSTEYKTVTVNDRSYNIIGYLDDFNNIDVIDCMYNSFLSHDTVQYIESSKALVLLDIPVVYTDENNATNTLESFNVLAVINDDYSTNATITPIAIISDEGEVVSIQHSDYIELEDNFQVDYQQLVIKGIIDQPKSEHWSVK